MGGEGITNRAIESVIAYDCKIRPESEGLLNEEGGVAVGGKYSRFKHVRIGCYGVKRLGAYAARASYYCYSFGLCHFQMVKIRAKIRILKRKNII